MYGKIFESIYDGTLAEDWRALITFQQMIVLCDPDGTIDMTPRAISRRTGIPIEHIEAGIAILENPDPYTRTKNDEGRRILRIDDHRPWGWVIVNHKKYKNLRTSAERRTYMKEYMKERREAEKLTKLTKVNSKQSLAQLANTDTDVYADTDTTDQELKSGKPDADSKKNEKKIINELNLQAGKKFKPTSANLKYITARLNEDYSVDDIIAVITMKVREWKDDPKMFQYLRPATLFNATKFNQYIGEVGALVPVAKPDKPERKLSVTERASQANQQFEERYVNEHQFNLEDL